MDLNHKRILVIKPSSLGDVIHALPLIHALKRRFPSSHVGWVLQRNLRSLLEADQHIDEIIPIEIPSTSEPSARIGTYFDAFIATIGSMRSLRKKFRDDPYDVILDLHASLRSGLISIMNPRGFRIGFANAKELNTFFQSRLVHDSPDKPHAVDKILGFADFLELTVDSADFELFIGASAINEARLFMDESGIDGVERIVYANPATRWATKFWNKRAWAELADRLINELNAKVIFGGGPSEIDYVFEIVALMKQEPVIAAGRLTPIGAAALIKASDIYVGVDSGPMHIAAFVGTPVIAIFGPTDPEKVGPYGPGNVVVRVENLSCLGCRKSVCSDRRCLDQISADRMFEEVQKLMNWNPLRAEIG